LIKKILKATIGWMDLNKALLRQFILFLAFFMAMTACFSPAPGETLTTGRPAPEIAGASWINSAPLTTAALKGRVVLVEFWTYG
jgi:hypothetical protein